MRNLIFILGFLSVSLNADVLHLTNGDTLQGKKIRDEGERIIWQSPLLGELQLSRTAVSRIEPESLPSVPVAANEQPSTIKILSVPIAVAPKSSPEPTADVAALSNNKLQSVATAATTKTSAKIDPFPKQFTMTDLDIDFTGEDSSGNDDELRYAIDVDSRFRRLRHRHYLNIEYDVEKEDGAKTTDEQLIGYKYNYFIEGPWLGYLSATREKDKLSDLQERLTASAGPGYEIYDTKILRWAFETGLAYTSEDFREDEDRESWGWHYGMDWRWIMEETGLEFFQNHALLQSFDDSSDWEFESESGMRFRVIGNLKGVLKLEYDYDNLPAENKDEFDRTWTVGASYGW
jgi:hypothetical protein